MSVSLCDTHDFKEEYYGYKCLKCGMFVPFGCEWWAADDDDIETFEEEDYPSDDWLEEHQYDEDYE